MKKAKKILALISSITMLLCFAGSGITVLAEDTEYDTNYFIVTVTAATPSNSSYYLTNGCMISQNEFEQYSGEYFELQYGDVIKVYCSSILPASPAQFGWNNSGKSKIEYIGKVADYYETKELKVYDVNSRSSITFTDDDGEKYLWHRESYKLICNNPYGMAEYGFNVIPSEFDPALMEVGQEFICAVSPENNYVIIPVYSFESGESGYLPDENYAEEVPAVTTAPTDSNAGSDSLAADSDSQKTTVNTTYEITVTETAKYTDKPVITEDSEITREETTSTSLSEISTAKQENTTYETTAYTEGKPDFIPAITIISDESGVIFKPVIIVGDEENPPDKWYGNGDFTTTVNIGKYDMDYGNFVDILVIGSENYTASQNGNESLEITFSEDYMKSLPSGEYAFTVRFEKVDISTGILFFIPGIGDVDMNGEVDLYDIIKIAEYMIGSISLDESEMKLADYNGDGKVNLYDAIKIAESLI